MKNVLALILFGFVFSAHCHFQVILPPTEALSRPKTITLSLLFTHPMDNGPLMNMGNPIKFGVLANKTKTDLLSALRVITEEGKKRYSCEYMVKAPGDYIFYLEPAPYWEPIEQKMIIHYTKVCVGAMQTGEGWDAMVGFPVEIAPLTRPYGIYTGNSFRGVVMRNGKPVPFAKVEVEYLNNKDIFKAPSPEFTTQVIKADANGVFAYTMPIAGWWGFAALVDGTEKIKNPNGKLADVELGALIWVRCRDILRN